MIFFGRNTKKVNSGNMKAILSRKKGDLCFHAK